MRSISEVRIILMTFFVLVFCYSIRAQEADRVYSKRLDNHTFEQIVLRSDGVFEFTRRGFTYKISEKGDWKIINDSLLVLDNRKHHSDSITVVQNFVRKLATAGTVITVRDKKSSSFNFSMIIEHSKLELVTLENQLSPLIIPIRNVNSLTLINGAGYKYRSLNIKPKTNVVEITIDNAFARIFDTEIWKFNNEGNIIPKDTKGNNCEYSLERR